MENIFAALIAMTTYTLWGLFLIEQKWWTETDLNIKQFSISLIPVAALTWLSLYIAKM